VAELADAQASGACCSNTVRVQVPSSALWILFQLSREVEVQPEQAGWPLRWFKCISD